MMIAVVCQAVRTVRRQNLLQTSCALSKCLISKQHPCMYSSKPHTLDKYQQIILRSSVQSQQPATYPMYNHRNFTVNTQYKSEKHEPPAGQLSNESSIDTIYHILNDEDVKKLKILQLEHDVWYSLGVRVPENVSEEMWLDILRNYKTPSSRKKIYKYWAKKQLLKEIARKDKEKRQLEREKTMVDVRVEQPDDYSNRFLQRYPKTRMNQQLFMPNLVHSQIHGPHLIFDMGFHNQMTTHEINNITSQIMDCHGFNKQQNEPFHFHFCNFDANTSLSKTFYKLFVGVEELMYTFTDKSFLEHYPSDQVVYLSPDAPNLLEKFDHHSVYIIGGIVDKATEEPLTFAKAKRENIRCAKLPLDRHLQWVQGSKALTLDQMVKILCTLKDTDSDWNMALKHVPKRKFNWRIK